MQDRTLAVDGALLGTCPNILGTGIQFARRLSLTRFSFEELVFYTNGVLKGYTSAHNHHRSNSIKHVLPVIVPSLDYKSLEDVHNGREAGAATVVRHWCDVADRENLEACILQGADGCLTAALLQLT